MYESVDATNIVAKYNCYFGIVIFKSVLGGIGKCGAIDREKACADSICDCLKTEGIVLFAENMRATSLHMILRKKFTGRGESWHYETEEEIENIVLKEGL